VANGEPRTTGAAATDSGPAGLARYGLPALAGLLLIAVFLGIAASTPAAATARGPWHGHGLLAGAALEVALVLLFVVVWTLGRRSSRRGYPVLALRKMLERVIVTAIILVGAVLILLSLHLHVHKASPPRRLAGQGGHGKSKLVKLGGRGPHLPWLPDLLLALLILIVAIAVAGIVLRRRQARRAGGYQGEFTDEGEELQRAVESGLQALRTVDDARAAIIACYRAMEVSLAGAGAARAAAETPDELLARAGASGLVHGGAASRLTALFYEARYSTHALPASALDSARHALDEISADLSIELAYARETDDGR
jgi:Domain of unknown function (DUF4129)